MIHHETITAKRAPCDGEDGRGSFNVIEDSDGFHVVAGADGHYLSEHGSLRAATAAAKREAAAYDRYAREDEKRRNAPPPPQDIAFWPDYHDRELPPEHRKTWCIAQRLTPGLRAKGHTLAIHPATYEKMRQAWAAEVREAVKGRLIDLVSEGLELNASAEEIAARILADPAVGIIVEHHDRPGWPPSARA